MPDFGPNTRTRLGVLAVAVATTWAVSARWFSAQADVARELAGVRERLSVIEHHLNIRPPGGDPRSNPLE